MAIHFVPVTPGLNTAHVIAEILHVHACVCSDMLISL